METNQQTRLGVESQGYEYRPKLSFYHANQRGTGAAIALELIPARARTDGAIMLSAANQMSLSAGEGANRVHARFDWKNKIVVKLDFSDLSRMLQVFRGECESLEDGKGLYHQTSSFSTKICLQHLLEPVSGYSLDLYRKPQNGAEIRAHILLTPYEALGLSESIAGSLAVVSFGIPALLPQDLGAAETRRGGEDGRPA